MACNTYEYIIHICLYICPLINTYLQISMYSLCIYTEEESVIILVLITKSEWEAQNSTLPIHLFLQQNQSIFSAGIGSVKSTYVPLTCPIKYKDGEAKHLL